VQSSPFRNRSSGGTDIDEVRTSLLVRLVDTVGEAVAALRSNDGPPAVGAVELGGRRARAAERAAPRVDALALVRSIGAVLDAIALLLHGDERAVGATIRTARVATKEEIDPRPA
jgi:hypothetical protein